MLVSGGYNTNKIVKVDDMRRANRLLFRSPRDEEEHSEDEGASRQRNAANFVPGSGGLEVNVKGTIMDVAPTYNEGMDLSRHEEDEARCVQRLRERWLTDLFDKPESE